MRMIPVAVGILVMAFSVPAVADDFDDTIKNFKQSETAQQYFKTAYGYAVFPTIGKAGVGIGGAGGKGRVYAAGKPTGESTMLQVSVGIQLGGQAYSQIIFFQDKHAYDEFTAGNFEFGAGASAVAITVGAAAQAGTTGASASAGTSSEKTKGALADYYKGMAVLTLAKGGLMYEAALAGQKYSFKKL